jgi:hypothetical protein
VDIFESCFDLQCSRKIKAAYFNKRTFLKPIIAVDRVIEKKTWSRKRILTIVGIVGILVLIGASYYLTSWKSRLNVEAERITISESNPVLSKNLFLLTESCYL